MARALRAILASIAGLAAGLTGALFVTAGLRATLPSTDLLWNVVPVVRVAGWLVAVAHGLPLRFRATAGLRGSDVSLGRLGQLVAGAGPPEITFGFSLVLVPIGLLGLVGLPVALVVRRSDPPTAGSLALTAAVAGIVHGAGVAAIARLARVSLGFAGTFAPEVGLGSATGSVGLVIGPSVVQGFLLGATWGAAFALAGGLSTRRMRSLLAPETRLLFRGWLRGLGAAAGIFAVAFLVGGAYALATGRVPSARAVALAGLLLSANAAAAGLVLAHGASMSVALDAGPLTGWERIDFLHVGVSGGPAPAAAWLVALVPIVCGVVAARFISRRSELSALAIAGRFAVLWGLTIASLALLLRVRVLSSFSVGGLQLGGGRAAIDPLVSMALGAGWGGLSSWLGAALGSRSG